MHRNCIQHHVAIITLLCAPAFAGEIARWDAGNTARSHGVTVDRGAWTIETIGGRAVAALKPSADYYHRAAFSAKVAKGITGPVWLSIEYFDRGYALISVSPGVGQTAQSGIARLDSGRYRHAVLYYEHPEFARGIRIEGAGYLRALVITDVQPPEEPLPEVKSRLTFRVPSQRVTTGIGYERSVDDLPEVIAGLRNSLPLMKALGFNGVESYVRWGWVERKQGTYDWSYYDAILAEIERNGMQWFPMLLAGSGYALPDWLYYSPQNVGFRCLEHGLVNDTQSIFYPGQAVYARHFIFEFGKHYGGQKSLLGIRLGPSGDYGEAQYPARGPGFEFKRHHTHQGYWAADEYAQADFRRHLEAVYPTVADLSQAWGSKFPSFGAVHTFLPITATSYRQRLDFDNWYMGAMSNWCEKWAVWAREAMPHTFIHQSSGGWGLVEVGTDYSFQARTMARLHGGIRLTNESDNYPDNFTITRMASSAARFYGADLGYEPGGFGCLRGVMARLYNAITNGAIHLFYYNGNLTANDQAVNAWLKHAELLDQRAKPLIQVASFYPDTALKLDDDVLRFRFASAYFQMGRSMRSVLDFDYVSEQMIGDGALDRFKILMFLWGQIIEKPVLEKIDRWVRDGGTVICPIQPRGPLTTVEGDTSIFARWQAGDTGKGTVVIYPGDSVPGEQYARFVRSELQKRKDLAPQIQAALRMQKTADVYWSVLQNGKLALLNFSDNATVVKLADGRSVKMEPYGIMLQ